MGPVAARLSAIADAMERFDRRVGLAGGTIDPGAVKWLNLGEAQLNTLTADEAAVAAVAVANLAFHLQSEQSRLAALARRLESAVDKLLAPVVAKAPGFQWGERRASALLTHPEAAEIDSRAAQHRQEAERLQYLGRQADTAAHMLSRLAETRRRHRRDDRD